MPKLNKLYLLHGKRCHWCHVQCILPKKGKNTPYPPPNFATTDHLYSKLNPLRNLQNKNDVVMACYKCNHTRGKKDCTEQFREEHRRRSGTTPRKPEKSALNPVIADKELLYKIIFG